MSIVTWSSETYFSAHSISNNKINIKMLDFYNSGHVSYL